MVKRAPEVRVEAALVGEQSLTSLCRLGVYYFFCAYASAATPILTATSTLQKVTGQDTLTKAVEQATLASYALAVVNAGLAFSGLFALLYLTWGPSLQSFKNLISTVVRQCGRSPVRPSPARSNMRFKWYHPLIWLWAGSAGLLFAAINRQAVKTPWAVIDHYLELDSSHDPLTLEIAGRIVGAFGFTSGFLLAFTPRVHSMLMMLERLTAKKHPADKLFAKLPYHRVSPFRGELALDDGKITSDSKSTIALHLSSKLREKNETCYTKYVPPLLKLLGFAELIIIAPSILFSLIPSSISGVEIITNSNIGRSEHYTNWPSFFGLFATALTLVFYGLANFNLIQILPSLYIQLSTAIRHCRSYPAQTAVLGLKLVHSLCSAAALALAYHKVGEDAVVAGSLDYLPAEMQQSTPIVLAVALSCMIFYSMLMTWVKPSFVALAQARCRRSQTYDRAWMISNITLAEFRAAWDSQQPSMSSPEDVATHHLLAEGSDDEEGAGHSRMQVSPL